MTLVEIHVCEWCSKDLVPPQRVACSTSCRLKRWRWLNGVPRAEGLAPESPPAGSVLAAGSSAQALRPIRSNAAEGASRVSTSGLQGSFGRIERTAFEVLTGPPAYFNAITGRELAREIAVRSLPEKQRARLEARS